MNILVIFFALVSLLSCNTKVSQPSDAAVSNRTLASKAACDRGECPCDSALGPINHGSKITTYSASSVQCDKTCSAIAEEVTCNNGVFSKDITGRHIKCEVLECPSCAVGQSIIPSGVSVDMYNAPEVGCRASCDDATVKLRRTCILGTMTGSDSFRHFSCQRKTCRCPLPDNSAFISLDGRVKLYSAQQAACGSTCEANYAQQRTCTAQSTGGAVETFSLDGSTAHRFSSCQEATNCFCTLPNNLGVLSHGQTRTISTVPSVPCGGSCSSQPSVTVRCDNGQFRNNANATQIIDFASTTYTNYKHVCQVAECRSCTVPGTNTSVMHGSSYRFAKKSQASCSEQCEFKDRTCVDNAFTGDTTFNAAQCTRRACECPVPDIQGLKVSVGNTWTFYPNARAQCGQTCAQSGSALTCNEVAGANNTYSYAFGNVTQYPFSQCQEATGCSCALPGGLGSIENNKTVTLTSETNIACGTRCDSVPSLSMRCDNGLLYRTSDGTLLNTTDPAFPYKYYCQKATCAACPLRGFGNINNGIELTLYSKSQMGCGDKPELFTFQFKCENGALLRNGNPYSPATDPNAPTAYFTSYSFNCPGCPLPWGGSIGEGTTVRAFKYFGTVVNNCGRGCKSQERKCTNGVLSGESDYTLDRCDNTCAMEGGGAPPRGCLLPWQNSYVTPFAEIPIFRKKKVVRPGKCSDHMILARCDMLSGTFKVPFEYIYPACAEVDP
jgi:hypothetical protein